MSEEEGAAADSELLARYVAGVATGEEIGELEARLPSDDALRLEVERLQEIWNRSGPRPAMAIPPERIDAAWVRLRDATAAPSAQGAVAATPPRTSPDRSLLALRSVRPPWRAGVIAASLLAAAAAALWVLLPGDTPSRPTVAATAATREFVAPAGSILTIGLPDGTRVILAPESRLTAPVDLAGTSRDATLIGRAYFEVSPDPARPFRVVAGGSITRVLGTAFDVRAYPGAWTTEVVVRSGQVAIRAANQTEQHARKLGRADQAVVSADGAVEVRADVDVDALLGWTTGTLAFRGTPLRDVIPELESWFDVEIQLADPALSGRRITATFEEEGTDVVLGAVAELVGATVRRSGRQVVFAPFRSR